MRYIFKGQNLLELAEYFKSNQNCLDYSAEIKWANGYICKKCGYSNSQTRKNQSRTCSKCSHTESTTANTLFHKVKFGVRKAFFICFEMSTSTKSLSANYISVRYGVIEKTARLFMHKVRESMKSSMNSPMNGIVHVDEFVVGGKEEGKVRRMYAMRIENYSHKQLKTIFKSIFLTLLQ
jgi:hypothetical protein